MRANSDRQRPGLLWVAALAVLLHCGVFFRVPIQAIGSELRYTPIVKAVQIAGPAVVNIQGRKIVRGDQLDAGLGEAFRQVNGMGTGIIIDPRGYILTNYHVVENVELIQVTLHDAQTYTGRLKAYDKTTDLAIVKIDADEPLTTIVIGESSDLMPGEPVIAVGNAFGYHHTVTRGIISALHREVQVSTTQHYHDLIQTDASINPGNSGGPLLNIDGEMIGINVAVRVGAQGIGFAIPVDEAMKIVTRLLSLENIEHVRHGVYGETRQTQSQRFFVVTSLARDSSGERCGLRVGDVITAVENTAIANGLDFERALIGRPLNEPVPIKIMRDGQPRTLSLVLSEPRPSGDSFSSRTWSMLGLKLQPIAASEFARRYTSQYRGGLLVTDVRANSAAAEQGIRVGDVLVGLHIWETISKENVLYVLSQTKLADFQPLKFYILRNGETLYGHLRINQERRLASRQQDLAR